MNEKEEHLRFVIRDIVRIGQAFQVAAFVIGAFGGWVVSRWHQGIVLAAMAAAIGIIAFGYLVAHYGALSVMGFRSDNAGGDKV